MADRRSPFIAILSAAALGVLIALPALLAAVMSAGAGHGRYVAARALFPLPMLLTLVEGRIGPVAGTLALLQFPLYGALLGWCRWRGDYLPAVVLALLHMVAAMACFAGVIPDFS